MGMNQYADLSTVPYISQYVPTNVQFLYNVAKDQVEQQDKTRKEVNDQLKEWAKFHSLSDIDNQNYYDIAINPVKDLIAQGAANPELMKTVAYRNALTNQISNVDYAALSKLEKNATQYEEYQKMLQNLAARGQYNPEWHDIDFSKWDTLGANGMFTATTPLAYASVQSLVQPYFDKIKDSYLYTKGGYDYTGVSAATARAQVNANMSDILSLPQIQKQIQVYQTKYGMTKAQAVQEIQRQAYTAADEAAHATREANPYTLAEMKQSYKNSGNGGGINSVGGNGLSYLTDELYVAGLRKQLAVTNARKAANFDRFYKDFLKNYEAANGDPAKQKNAKDAFENAVNKVDKNSAILQSNDIHRLLNSFADEYTDGKKRFSFNGIQRAVNAFNKKYVINVAPDQKDALMQAIPGAQNATIKQNGLPAYHRITLNSAHTLWTREVFRAAGLVGKSTIAGGVDTSRGGSAWNKFEYAMQAGKFTNAFIIDNGDVFQQGGKMIQKITVGVPVEDLVKAGVDNPKLYTAIGARQISTDYSETAGQSTKSNYKQVDGDAKLKTTNETQYGSSTRGKQYIQFDIAAEIPLQGQLAEATNQAYIAHQLKSAKLASEEYYNTNNRFSNASEDE